MSSFVQCRAVKKLLIVIALLSVAGCAGLGSKAVDKNILASLQGRTLSLIIHQAPDFLAITPDKNMLKHAGFNAAATEGNQLIRENNIYDPAGGLSKGLAEALGAEYGLLFDAALIKKSRSRETEALVRLANRRDYVLSVETTGWLFTHNVKLLGYHLKYYAKAHLIDTGTAKVIWKNSCDYDSLRQGNPLVKRQELLANDAAYLKQTLDEAATFCVNYFFDDFRGK